MLNRKHFSNLILTVTILSFMTVPLAAQAANRLGITMVDIPGGSFTMGSCAAQTEKERFLGASPCSNPDSDASQNETPKHRVSVKAFQMSKTEVTLGQFKAYIKATGSSELVNDEFIKYNAYGDDAPVVQVSWNDAQDLVAWLNKADGGGYRLPSEAEWEYACRAGGNQTYCGSNSAGAVAWYDGNSNKHQHSVGGKQANAFGLYDMSGNVWEWVQDCHHDSYSGAPANGSAWTSSCSGDGRVLRGGSWDYIARGTRAAGRFYGSHGIRGNSVGFRLARTR